MHPRVARLALPIAAALAVLLSAQGGAGAAPPKESERWHRVRSDHFTLYGNVGERRLIEVAKRVEQFREALLKATMGLARSSSVPTDVFVFNKREAFETYAMGEDGKPLHIIGYFRPTPDRNFIALDVSGYETPYRAVFHEYVHYVVDNNLPGAPTWLNEGLAEFYSTLSVQPGNKEARLGEPIQAHVAILRASGLMPIDRLFAIDQGSPEYNEGERQGIFYAQSWDLVHWLIVDDPARRARFNDYLNRLRRGEDAGSAFQAAVGVDGAAIRKALEAYVEKSTLNYYTLKFGDELTKLTYQGAEIPRAEAVARLGDLLVRSGPSNYSDAETHLNAALAIDPAQPVARVALAELARGRKQWDRAAALYDAALADGGPAAATGYGWMLLERYVAEHSTLETQAELPGQIGKARELFRGAIAKAPDNAYAQHGLARTYLFADEDLSEGIVAAQKAYELVIGRPDVSLDLIALVAASGRTEAAAMIFEKTLRRETTDPEYLHAAEMAISYGDRKRASAAARAGRYEEARTILETALGRAKDPEVRAGLTQDLAAFRAVAAPNDSSGKGAPVDPGDSAEKLEAGVRAANAGEYAKARAIFEEVARTTISLEVKRTAEELIQRTSESEIEARAMARVQKASMKAQLGDLAGAVKELDAILRDEPRLSQTLRASIIKNRDILKGKLKKS